MNFGSSFSAVGPGRASGADSEKIETSAVENFETGLTVQQC